MIDADINRFKSRLSGGIHGVSHSCRVENSGILLARLSDKVDVDVVRWFAYIHDSQRIDDGADAWHGERAAKSIETIRNTFLTDLDDTQLELLKTACAKHTIWCRSGDPTIDICFDADRLDLQRCGIEIQPEKMATEIGRFFAVLMNKFNSYEVLQHIPILV